MLGIVDLIFCKRQPPNYKSHAHYLILVCTPNNTFNHYSIVGSVVECSPATRAARVRFPDDAKVTFYRVLVIYLIKIVQSWMHVVIF